MTMSYPQYTAYTYEPLVASPLSMSTTPQMPTNLLMPSIDIASPSSPRVPSRYATPMLDDQWETVYASPVEFHTPTAGTRGFTPRRTCSPYGSPSNPFHYSTSHAQSTNGTPSRAPVNLHKAIQRITAGRFSPWTTGRKQTTSSGWKEHPEESVMFDTVVKVLFWAALVVFISALCGVGEEPLRGKQLSTRAWSPHVPAASGLAGMGWKGVGMVDWADQMTISGIASGIQGIWDDES